MTQVVLKAALCDDEQVVNKLSNALYVVEELTNSILKDVRGDAHTHQKSIILILSKWSNDSAELTSICTQN